MSDREDVRRVTKAVTVNPQRAEALADGLQSIITQPCQPNGDMHTIGDRTQPGPTLDGLERFAIHSGGQGGALIATAVLKDVVPINCGPVDIDEEPPDWYVMVEPVDGRLTLWGWDDGSLGGPLGAGWNEDDISHELDHGTFQCGWWAWMLEDIRRLPTPIECSGHPGVWMIPGDIAEQLAEQPA